MDLPTERAPETLASAFEPAPPPAALAQDEMAALHRAINERRAQQENPEMLRHLRSL